ncbi:bifunctional (p)ppGpp synthetase/guanosine-3',5'-bis(diphosphate) 3'-pyrophosphohydrolase [Candidatus Falkowbacteria bacterium]|jgi:GTP diphosphokinase / guanosine-3',5'-bis(diphosphate) 3'-diphosphatase|nr:bifunctional (p)ppGpp synthetase/guanosine-3',5'-bis(diphosphate) 3'-pyrophosphohydrolase [Candidatus Falkowbacteria bacterium]MBT7007722.1 bifunctional (p)ppGpp synthetase/guanosine-3',5'-bis(diphosphate) 3'-pyrophosphohydrolase [Candidatus Falkowbacteria bacterium]
MNVDKIIQTINRNHPDSDTTTIGQCYDFLKEYISKSESLKNDFLEKAISRAQTFADKNSGARFTAATLLFELPQHDPNYYKKIRRHVNEEIAQLVKSHHVTAQKFPLPEYAELYEHVVSTTTNLSSLHIDTASMCAAMLHELPLESDVTVKEIEKEFGSEIANLIDYFQQIISIQPAHNAKYINNLRQMVIVMARDIRAIIIKMCSNIDRMRSGIVKSKNDQELKEIATESLEILAPIADMLGIWRIRWQLEDYAFKILKPTEYEKIGKRFNVDERKNREKYIQKTKNLLEKKAYEAGVKCSISGRFKHFYSIYKKMKYKNRSFNEILDVFALRIIVEKPSDCYLVLGIIHNLWKPKNRRIKDYIAAPKSNNYQSLHTTVFGLNGKLTEFQIRTNEMDKKAKFGVASHWSYKNKHNKNPEWLQEILVKHKELTSDEEFYSSFSTEFLSNKIFVFTPKGDIIALNKQATPVDFAYHIHSEVGHKCKAALVNEIAVPLDYQLSTNDIVQVITDRNQKGPDQRWLEFVQSNAAKKQITDYVNHHTKEGHDTHHL